MNSLISTLAIAFPVMVPTVPSLLITMLLLHLAIRIRQETQAPKSLPVPKQAPKKSRRDDREREHKALDYQTQHRVFLPRDGVEL